MEVTKTNEQFNVKDVYTYNDVDYNVSGTVTKSDNSTSVWMNVEQIGSVSYSKSNDHESVNVDCYQNTVKVPFNEVMNTLYNKSVQAINLIAE